MRHFALIFHVLTFVGLTIPAVPVSCTEPAATAVDGPPPGYKSADAVKLAILARQLKLVDTRLEVPASIEVRKDIEYGKGDTEILRLDLYAPKEIVRPVPGLIFIHGGGWKKGHRGDYHSYCVKFAERGYVVATISYRLLPNETFPAPVHDVKCAVRWMRANAERLHVDGSQIGLVGGSAGAHLAMMVGYSSDVPELEGSGGYDDVSSRVRAIVDLYGPTDLTTPTATGNEGVIDFLGGKKFADAPDQYEFASPISHVTQDDPPTLIFHGTIDEIVPIAQADLLVEKLRSTGVPYRYERLEGWPHTMDLAEVVNDYCWRRMIDFFNVHLPLPESRSAE